MLNQFDVIIIGAGPAGACAAKMLTDMGHNVVVIEREQFPRFSIGESLLPQSMSFLEEAGLKHIIDDSGFQFKNGAAFFKNGQYSVFNFAEKVSEGPATTYQVKRAVFDKKLADAAQKAGAEIRYRHQVNAYTQEQDAVVLGISDLETNQTYQLKARFVLDASGFGRVLPRLLDLEIPSDFPVRQAIFTHINDQLPESFDRHKILITVHPSNPDIWFWLIPFSDGTCSLGVVGERPFFAECEGMDNQQILWHFINQADDLASLLVGSKVNTSVREIVGYTANVKTLYGDRFALLGNAGEFLDPVFSSGVTIALKSAVLAAPLVSKQLKGQNVDWESEFSIPLRLGISTFKAFVTTWYDCRLQNIIFYPDSQPTVKQMICSILAGYAWDETNPYVGGNGRRLKILAEICAS